MVCGADVIDMLLGGTPEEVPENYISGSPINLLPFGVPQRLITGVHDLVVPPETSRAYVAAAKKAGDDIIAVTLNGASHFEPIVPTSKVWPEVQKIILSLIVE